MLLILLLALPLLTAIPPLLSRRYRRRVGIVVVVSSAAQFLIALLLARQCLEQNVVAWGPGEFFRVEMTGFKELEHALLALPNAVAKSVLRKALPGLTPEPGSRSPSRPG